jgi:hypothetical protein
MEIEKVARLARAEEGGGRCARVLRPARRVNAVEVFK